MTEDRIIAYLLEELPKEEEEQFEEECFSEEDWPNQIELAEEDLIDAYLRRQLTPEQRLRFEGNYLTTETRQERGAMAAALLRHLDNFDAASQSSARVPSRELSWAERLHDYWSSYRWPLRAAAALTVLIIIASGLWLYLSRESKPQVFATLTLSMTVSNRGEGAPVPKVTLPLNADALRIVLKLPAGASPASNYRVALDKDTEDTQTLKIVEQDAQSVAVELPAAQLKRGQYALKLFVIKA